MISNSTQNPTLISNPTLLEKNRREAEGADDSHIQGQTAMDATRRGTLGELGGLMGFQL